MSNGVAHPGYKWDEQLGWVPQCTGYVTNNKVDGKCTEVKAGAVLNSFVPDEEEEPEVEIESGVVTIGENCWGFDTKHIYWGEEKKSFVEYCLYDPVVGFVKKISDSLTQRWDDEGEDRKEIGDNAVDNASSLWEQTKDGFGLYAENKIDETKALVELGAAVAEFGVEVGEELVAQVQAQFNPVTENGEVTTLARDVFMEAYDSCRIGVGEENGVFGQYANVTMDEMDGCTIEANDAVSQWANDQVQHLADTASWTIQDDNITRAVPHGSGYLQDEIALDVISTTYGMSEAYQLEMAEDADSVGGGWMEYSDERLKSDIKEIPDGDKIAQLRPVSFVKGGVAKTGFVAQDVKEVFPNSVKEAKNGMLGTSNTEIIAHLVKKVQELTVEVAALKAG